jgi:hypothetical protein
MQVDAPAQLTQVPPQPICNPSNIFTGRDCQDRINLYNQAVQQRQREELQLYVSRQKELASSQAAAPLQQQIADLNKLVTDQQGQIKNLHEQMVTDANAASQARSAAHTEGLQQGAGIGLGGILILFALIFGAKKLMQHFTVTKKPLASAASA